MALNGMQSGITRWSPANSTGRDVSLGLSSELWYETNRQAKGLDESGGGGMHGIGLRAHAWHAGIYIAAIDFPALSARVKLIAVHSHGGVTASTEVIAVKRHTGGHASVIACKNTIANTQMAYAA